MANRLALDMGLNLDASSLAGSNLMCTEEIELRRQIYWALYCDDKLAAIYTGRVCNFLVMTPGRNSPSLAEEDELTFYIAGRSRSCEAPVVTRRHGQRVSGWTCSHALQQADHATPRTHWTVSNTGEYPPCSVSYSSPSSTSPR